MLGRDVPLEVIVPVEGWIKVRDVGGTIGWVEKRTLGDRRTLVVRVPLAEVRAIPDDAAPIVFRAEQNVLLELAEPATSAQHDGDAGLGRRQASRRPGGIRADIAGVRTLTTIAIVGAGAWGTALAAHLSRRDGLAVTLWARDAAQAAAMAARRSNDKYLPGIVLPESLTVTSTLATAAAASLVVVATPAAALPGVARDLATAGARAPLFWLSKGFVTVPPSAAHPSGVALAHQHLAPMWRAPVGVISGPSFADEVARGLPTAVAVAATDAAVATHVASLLCAETLRAYESDDIAGVEVAGAVKNVLAIAAGASDGLGFGHDARAALITRGLAETGRLCTALGGRRETMMGLAGLGDLVLTCTGDLRATGASVALARGTTLPDVLAELGHVAEGVAPRPRCARCPGSTASRCPSAQRFTACSIRRTHDPDPRVRCGARVRSARPDAALVRRGCREPLRAAVFRSRLSRPAGAPRASRAQHRAAVDVAVDQDRRLPRGLRLLPAGGALPHRGRGGRHCSPSTEVVAAAEAAKRTRRHALLHGRRVARTKARDIEKVQAMVSAVKALGLETCATLGMLSDGQARAS